MNDFIKDLDIFATNTWKCFFEAVKDTGIKSDIFSVELFVSVDEEFLNKYDLNNKITFMLHSKNGKGKTIYLYNGMKIEPNCYYVRPKGYQIVSTLEMLQEAIKQNTYKPDITHLEMPEHV